MERNEKVILTKNESYLGKDTNECHSNYLISRLLFRVKYKVHPLWSDPY